MPIEVCPRCGQSLYWCGESGVCEMGGVMEKFEEIEEYLDGHVSEFVENLRRFFLHERDQELGRWRWHEHPDYVIYETEDAWSLTKALRRLVNERDGSSSLHRRGDVELPAPVAAYFEAHPEPKPWHDAKPGEVWELTYRSPSQRETSNRVMTCVDDGGNISFFNEYRLHTVNYTGIESARRIWPEVS